MRTCPHKVFFCTCAVAEWYILDAAPDKYMLVYYTGELDFMQGCSRISKADAPSIRLTVIVQRALLTYDRSQHRMHAVLNMVHLP